MGCVPSRERPSPEHLSPPHTPDTAQTLPEAFQTFGSKADDVAEIGGYKSAVHRTSSDSSSGTSTDRHCHKVGSRPGDIVKAANLFVRTSPGPEERISAGFSRSQRLASIAGSPATLHFDVDVQTDSFRLEVREMGPTMPVRWKKGESIGSGSFGTVYLGLNNETGELLAVKEVAILDGGRSSEAVEQLEREVNLLSSLHHPNIVRYVGTVREPACLFIFLEYVPGGSIASLISRFGPLDEQVIRIYTRQLVSGLSYLHAQRTVHRDVKGANLLVDKNGRVKLADFGMAKQMVEQVSFTKSFKGSAFWMAPEVIRQQGHGVAADIWSIGCTVLEMATGKPPWAQCSTQVQAIFKIASSTELPAIPETLSPEATEFILLCLQRDPVARPSADELLRHPFVSNCCCDVPALAGPTVDFVSTASSGLNGSLRHHHNAMHNNQNTPELPGSLNSSLVSSRYAQPAMYAVELGKLSGGKPNSHLPPHLQHHLHHGHHQQGFPSHYHTTGGSTSGKDAAADAGETLASLVLGSSLHVGKRRTQNDLASNSRPGDGGKGGGGFNSSFRGGSGTNGGGGGGGGAGLHGIRESGAAQARDEEDDAIDFTTQPKHFKARGLLSLPPLRMLHGQQLPAVRCYSLQPDRQDSSPFAYS